MGGYKVVGAGGGMYLLQRTCIWLFLAPGRPWVSLAGCPWVPAGWPCGKSVIFWPHVAGPGFSSNVSIFKDGAVPRRGF